MEETTPNYLVWHFYTVPLELLKAWRNYLVFVLHFFSTGTLLKSLFAPWKRQTVAKETAGFDLNEAFRVFSFNLISRIIGVIVRTCLILWALLAEIVVVIAGTAFFVISLLTPLVSLPTYLLAIGSDFKWKRLRSGYRQQPDKFVDEFIKGRRGEFLFQRLGVNPEKAHELIKNAVPGTPAQSLPTAGNISEAFTNLASGWSPLGGALKALDLKVEDVKEVLAWFDREEERREKEARFWEKDNLLRSPGLGWGWNYGYTPNLDIYSVDMTQRQTFAHHLVGRVKEVSAIENILSRADQSNVIVIGEEGVGKRTVIYQFANNIREGKVYPGLKYKRVLEVNVNKVIGESKTPIVAQNKFEDILEEAVRAGNIILVIPSIDRFVSTIEDRIDLTPAISKTALSARVQVIGITTPALYQKHIYPNPTMSKMFGTVEVNPPSIPEAIEILETFVNDFERSKKVLITFQAVKEVVEKADRYISDIPFPEKAIDLLDETVVFALARGERLITPKIIDEVISAKTKVPIGEIAKTEKDKLVSLEKTIHRRLIDQEEAVSDLADAFRRARLDLAKRKKPAGVFLFLGPTGVGKTETAKALAEAYFGSEEKLVRLDMNEFQDDAANIRLLGYFEKSEPGILSKTLRENPFCVLLLDEFEKASKQILNLFLTAFDEGYLNDNLGHRLSLKEMVIICTSNAGAEFIRQKVTEGEDVDNFKGDLIDYLLKNGIFTPELLNRFDSVVVYKPLTHQHLREIAQMQLNSLNERLKERKVSLKITESLLERIVKEGYDPVFGARPMKRVIQNQIEGPIAKKLLTGEVVSGEIEL